MTPGGNPVYKCACCGVRTSAMQPDALCWCGYGHRANRPGSYMCLPFSVLKTEPELEQAFLACGCKPNVQEVGIVLVADRRKNRPLSG